MSLIDERQDFSDIADVFLLHGSMQSPAFLDGRLCALLALKNVTAEAWLDEVCLSLGVDQPKDQASAERLLGWRKQTLDALSASEMNYTPLLPDELFSLAEQAQGLKEWTQGFVEVLDEAVDDALRQRWSQTLLEALDDLPALSQIETDIDDSPENENDLFALTEHARMAAMMLYTEQHPGQPQVEQTDTPVH
ncbi:UPF0149 family protein [Vreelandella salicampi]|uniref:UPF0149 family protein n=1 Tax=Vreelandella salicampi TaxID=1449798 RepID=A0A7Z0RWL1_9GAMM|nr:UPF0149 family protein [Halomonas salicampi]NYS62350.1 UPF0149 family protein [Halomonas salicampi]